MKTTTRPLVAFATLSLVALAACGSSTAKTASTTLNPAASGATAAPAATTAPAGTTAATTAANSATTAASLGATTAAGSAAVSGGKIGLDIPRTDTDFWTAFASYVPKKASALGINLMDTTNSQNDVNKLVTNVQALTSQGARAIVMAPQDTGAVTSLIKQLNTDKIPVITVDTRPDAGDVYMVVRADNRAYGTQACQFLGKQLKGKGKVDVLEGDLASVNGRDRSEAFTECMKKDFPSITVFEEPVQWDGAKGQDALRTRLVQNPDLNGIYMEAGGAFLAPTLQLLKSQNLIVAPTNPKHIFIVSNDGISQEFDAIRAGQIDATVSQPADLYAQYAEYYAQQALAGKTFQPGPTDHSSTIVQVRAGVLEDQLAAPLVTSANVDDPSLWGNAPKS